MEGAYVVDASRPIFELNRRRQPQAGDGQVQKGQAAPEPGSDMNATRNATSNPTLPRKTASLCMTLLDVNALPAKLVDELVQSAGSPLM